jgi:hypothetical protein
MLSSDKLDTALAALTPTSFSGDVARRVGLAALLSPIASGGSLKDLEFLYASRRRNRFTPIRGPKTIYFGEDEDVGSAETKRVALLGSFAKRVSTPATLFWAHAHLPNVILDLTDPAVLSAIQATDAEIYDPDWKVRGLISAPEYLGYRAFASGRFAAIKYWSVRSRLVSQSRFCLAIFKSRVRTPMTVTFRYGALNLTEHWGA